MNRKTAYRIMDEEPSARGSLVRNFMGCNPYTVVEALVIWAQLADCPAEISKELNKLNKHLQHCAEFNS